jgi:hypothetical protein
MAPFGLNRGDDPGSTILMRLNQSRHIEHVLFRMQPATNNQPPTTSN